MRGTRILLLLASPYLTAATLTVNSNIDAVDLSPGDGVCSSSAAATLCTLRAAVQESNALAGADTIVLPAMDVTLTIPGRGEDRGGTGDLDFTGEVVLRGAGAQATRIDAGRLDRVLHVLPGASVSIESLTIQSGSSGADPGGGLLVESRGMVNLAGVSVLDCTASTSGGGVSLAAGAHAVVEQSLVALNRAGRTGGGLFLAGAALLRNTTISSNKAGGAGGGVQVEPGGGADMVHVTIHENMAPNGSALSGPAAAVGAVNSIFSGPPRQTGPVCSAAVRSAGHNLSSDTSCGLGSPGDLAGRNPKLSPLFRTGRTPTLTHAPLAGSPAIDAGDNGSSLPNDQHGFPRPDDGNGDGVRIVDIGALEHLLDVSIGQAYVTNTFSFGRIFRPVTVIDLLFNTVAGTIPVSRSEHIAAHPTQNQVWVTRPASNRVYIIDTGANTVVNSFDPGFTPHEIFFNPAGTLCFLPLGNTATFVYATANFQQVGGILPARFMAFSPSGDTAYVKYNLGLPTGTFSVIAAHSLPDLALGAYTTSDVGPIATDGFRLYNGAGGALEFRSAASLQPFFSIGIPNGQTAVDFATGSAPPRLYAATDGAVYAVDLTSDQIIGSVLATGTTGLALHPNNSYLALTRRSEQLYSAANANSLSITANIPIAGRPFKVAIQP